MRNKKRQRNLYLYLLIILGITVGFALLSTTLYINGTAGINKNTWDIHWDDESIVETQGSVEAMTPAAVIDTEKKNVSFAVELELPGDFYEFTVDAKNYGSINGAIDSVKIKFYKEDGIEEWETLPSYIKYSFTYADGSKVEKGDVLEAGKSKKYKFRIEYDSEATTLADGNKTIKPVIDIDEVQTVEEEVIKYNVGKVVYFDPVNYEWCDENSQEATCYKWIVVNKDSTSHDLFLLSNVSGFGWTTSNPATVIQTATADWSNYIEEPSTQSNFTSVHLSGDPSQNVDVVFKKARMLTRTEYDALSEDAKNTIGSYCGSLNTQLCTILDLTNNYVNQINPGGVYNTFPLSSISTSGSTMGANNDTRPVIKVRAKKYKETEKAYNLGDLVYFDPVSTNKCDSTTFDLNAVKTGTSTCYKWRVMTIDDNVSKSEIKLQLDHNLVNNSAWTYDNKNYYGPAVAMTNLNNATTTWTRISPLNYVYDSTASTCTTAGEVCNYGVMTCVNGICTIMYNDQQRGISGTSESPSRTRLITTEEIAQIIQTKYPSFDWTLDFDTHSSGAPYFSNTDYTNATDPKGVGTKVFSWLLENTVLNDYSGGTYDEYDAPNTSRMGYWTLSPAKYSFPNFAWVVQNNGHFSNYGVEDSKISDVGLRPVAMVKKAYITK